MKNVKQIQEEVFTVLALVFALALTSSYIKPEFFRNALFPEITPTSELSN